MRVLIPLVLASSAVAAPTPTVGIATVIDGDTLDIRSSRFRLHG